MTYGNLLHCSDMHFCQRQKCCWTVTWFNLARVWQSPADDGARDVGPCVFRPAAKRMGWHLCAFVEGGRGLPSPHVRRRPSKTPPGLETAFKGNALSA